MICPNCGAEIGNNKVCDYCGTSMPLDMIKEEEQRNKEGCPKCGSTNISFEREMHGVVEGKKSKRRIYKTVGLCKDCGFTWTATSPIQEPKKSNTWLWVLGWICIFPVPLTILMLRKKDMKPALKYGIIAAAWIVYLILALSRNSDTEYETSRVEPVKEVIYIESEKAITMKRMSVDRSDNINKEFSKTITMIADEAVENYMSAEKSFQIG